MTIVDRVETVTGSWSKIVTAATVKFYQAFEATVSTGDTVTLDKFTTITYGLLLKASDGSVITCTYATNVITVTQATTTDVAIVGFAYGTAA